MLIRDIHYITNGSRVLAIMFGLGQRVMLFNFSSRCFINDTSKHTGIVLVDGMIQGC